ncbi:MULTISPECIES: hypothetical protein [unclassified Vibrio]|uniref:hypothetical protein n=1 Tax=unclassified Vibrio TaxID=2614977 RepID=UPI00126979F3|nr:MULTISPECIES: hypothetical protein [unclassified Vibrio]QFT34848.1 hypothetical protein FIU99_00125 [Vibrio sp. THAF64]QGM32746.1 hypothetical protein GGC04_00125 [Vibrio sp. THAF191d]QGN68249.1 hypothetical protein GGC03_00125 [Vibrio sp. THAF191c]
MKKLLLGMIAIALPCTAMAGTSYAAFEGYIMALNTMAPNQAKHTVTYKGYVEKKCGQTLMLENISSAGFRNIITALDVADSMIQNGLERESLETDIRLSVMNYTLCTETFDTTMKSIVADKRLMGRYPHYAQFIDTWIKVDTNLAN